MQFCKNTIFSCKNIVWFRKEEEQTNFQIKKIIFVIMAGTKKYKLNPETLQYETARVSLCSKLFRLLFFFVSCSLLSLFCLWLFTSVWECELPKTIILRKKNEKWRSKIEIINRNLDMQENALRDLRMRDDKIYRTIFGLNEISPEVRYSGIKSGERTKKIGMLPPNSLLYRTYMRMDDITKQIYVQIKSFDDIYTVSKNAGDMASCIPAVSPLVTDHSKYRLSSPFGYRTDPITGVSKMHTGFDFACKPGTLVYATGDGVVEEAKFDLYGYGNHIVINHGFGYKTRYAHLSAIYVPEGLKVKRGTCLGASGDSGRSTGPHLHYEVIYKDKYVNPYDYFDLTMPSEDYKSMIEKVERENPHLITVPGTRIRR